MDKTKKEMTELQQGQESLLDSIALLQMQRKERTLRLRGIEEEVDDQINVTIIKELARWLDMKEEEIKAEVENVYRTKSVEAQAKKWPADCLITCKSMDFRNKILQVLRTNFK